MQKDLVREVFRVRYKQIRKRCNNPKDKSYASYGARGIKVRFGEFEDFYDYIKTLEGFSTSLQIDRIDNDLGYERGNMRFSTPSENCKNKNNNIKLVYKNEKICLFEFIKICGMDYKKVRAMALDGFTGEQIIEYRSRRYFRHPKRKHYKSVCDG